MVNKNLDPGNLAGAWIINEDAEVNSADLEQVYRSWCLSHSFEPNFVWMARSLRSMLPKLETKRKRVSVANEFDVEEELRWGMTYSGIGLAP